MIFIQNEIQSSNSTYLMSIQMTKVYRGVEAFRLNMFGGQWERHKLHSSRIHV